MTKTVDTTALRAIAEKGWSDNAQMPKSVITLICDELDALRCEQYVKAMNACAQALVDAVQSEIGIALKADEAHRILSCVASTAPVELLK
jgi:hypothetical protein